MVVSFDGQIGKSLVFYIALAHHNSTIQSAPNFRIIFVLYSAWQVSRKNQEKIMYVKVAVISQSVCHVAGIPCIVLELMKMNQHIRKCSLLINSLADNALVIHVQLQHPTRVAFEHSVHLGLHFITTTNC